MSDLTNESRGPLTSASSPGSDSSTNGGICSTISMLPDELLDIIFSFIGPGYYRYIAGTSRRFRNVYSNERTRASKETIWSATGVSLRCIQVMIQDCKLLQKQALHVKVILYTVSVAAAKDGNVGVLEWARQNGLVFLGLHFRIVGENDHVNVLKWINKIEASWEYFCLIEGAAKAGNVNIFDWIMSYSRHRHALLKEEHKELIWHHAGKNGHVSVLTWLHSNDLMLTCDEKIWSDALEYGRVDVLDWLVERGHQVPEDSSIVHLGVRRGHISVLEWAQDHGCTFTEEDCVSAAMCGHLATLQWLRANDCSWDGRVLSWAEERGHFRVATWARINGCPEEVTF